MTSPAGTSRAHRDSGNAPGKDVPNDPGRLGNATGAFPGTLLTCDLICYGVASPASFRRYLDMLERHHGAPVVRYAHRGAGIPDRGDEMAWFADGSVERGTARTRVWARLWYRNLIRESCTTCAYHALERPGDITIGDFWGIGGVIPGFADTWGTSCIIANDDRGLALVRSVADAFELVETRVEDVANEEQPMLRSLPPHDASRRFFSLERDLGFERACRAFGLLGWKASLGNAARGILRKLKAKREGAGRGDAPQDTSPEGAAKESDVCADDQTRAAAHEIAWDAPTALPRAFAAKNRSDDVRRESSSGGVFHALASEVIGHGGVVYGCAFDEHLRAAHIRCETMADVRRCMGSKYTQSDLDNALANVREDLAAGKLVLFTGTPCQVAAVRAYTGDASGARANKRDEPRLLPILFTSPQECCGCTACAVSCPVGAITMEPDEHGFPYPAIDAARCIGCGICLSACAFKARASANETEPHAQTSRA